MALTLNIVTPDGEKYHASATGVLLPGSEGDFGVLPGHERFLTPLRTGEVEIQTEGETLYGSISEGFADVSGEEVTVLVESCELAHEIDTARAELARSRAEQHLSQLGADEEEKRREQFEAALQRAHNRLSVGNRKS